MAETRAALAAELQAAMREAVTTATTAHELHEAGTTPWGGRGGR